MRCEIGGSGEKPSGRIGHEPSMARRNFSAPDTITTTSTTALRRPNFHQIIREIKFTTIYEPRDHTITLPFALTAALRYSSLKTSACSSGIDCTPASRNLDSQKCTPSTDDGTPHIDSVPWSNAISRACTRGFLADALWPRRSGTYEWQSLLMAARLIHEQAL